MRILENIPIIAAVHLAGWLLADSIQTFLSIDQRFLGSIGIFQMGFVDVET